VSALADVTTCAGCGTPLAQPAGGGRRRRWCSERCRKNTLYGHTCVDCGITTTYAGRPTERCADCARRHSKEDLHSRRARSEVSRGRHRLSDAVLVEAVRRADALGLRTAPSYASNSAKYGLPSSRTLILRFGSWNAARQAAGFSIAKRRTYRKRWSRDSCLAAVRELALAMGRPPTYREYETYAAETGAPSASTVRGFFGTWMAAIDEVAA